MLRILARAAAAAAIGHGHDIGPVLQRLVEVADVARDVLVAGDGEWNEGLGEGGQG